jgi:hypothetical protein
MPRAKKEKMRDLCIRAPESLIEDLDIIVEQWTKNPRRGRVTLSGVARALLIEGIEREKKATGGDRE